MVRKKKTEYTIRTKVEGIPAYALDELIKVGLYGTTREEVMQYIINDWLSGKWKQLSELEIKIEDARKLGYMKRRR